MRLFKHDMTQFFIFLEYYSDASTFADIVFKVCVHK